MTPTRMPMKTASAVTFFYALGYPIGNMAVSAMTPMAVLVFRFGFAAIILGAWAAIARVAWPTGRKLGHVAVSRPPDAGRPVLRAVPGHRARRARSAVRGRRRDEPRGHRTAGRDVPAGPFERAPDPGPGPRCRGSAGGVREQADRREGFRPRGPLLLVALVGLAAGGVYQQRFCADVDFRASTADTERRRVPAGRDLRAHHARSPFTTPPRLRSRWPGWCCSTRHWACRSTCGRSTCTAPQRCRCCSA